MEKMDNEQDARQPTAICRPSGQVCGGCRKGHCEHREVREGEPAPKQSGDGAWEEEE